jgi:hypothetical protein
MPRTAAQAEASRRNGARSRGPSTAAGKLRSAQNARRHGLRAKTMAPSDVEAFRRHAESLHRRLRPQGPLQQALCEQLARASWQVRQLDLWEARLCSPGTDLQRRLRGLATLLRYRPRAEKALHQALALFHQAQGRDRPNEPERPTAARPGRTRPPARQAVNEPDCPNEPKPPVPSSAACAGRTTGRIVRTNPGLPARTDEPHRPNEPEPPRALNRRQRRRLAALGRRRAT